MPIALRKRERGVQFGGVEGGVDGVKLSFRLGMRCPWGRGDGEAC